MIDLYVDISKACNRKWIADSKEKIPDTEGARISRSCFQNGFMRRGSYTFQMTDGETDIIACNGQKIDFCANRGYRYMDIAGFSTYGSYGEFFQVVYRGGNSQRERLFFQDAVMFGRPCVAVEKEYRCYYDSGSVMLEYVLEVGKMKRRAQIFAHRINLDFKQIPEYILLPDNDLIYVVAITLKR